MSKYVPMSEKEHRLLAGEICGAAAVLRGAFSQRVNGKRSKGDRLAREFMRLLSPAALCKLKMAAEDAACADLGDDLGMRIWGEAIRRHGDKSVVTYLAYVEAVQDGDGAP